MAETVTLTTPIDLGAITTYVGQSVRMDFAAKVVMVHWKDNATAKDYTATYPTPIPIYPPGHVGPKNTATGAQMITVINTGNHTATSAAKKVWQQLQTDGYIGAGPVTGTPE